MAFDATAKVSNALLELARKGIEAMQLGKPAVDWREAAAAFSIRLRLVRLRKRNWWRQDHGPLLGFRREGGIPVLLVPHGRRGYRLQEPSIGTLSDIDAHVASTLSDEAFMPYPVGHELGGDASRIWLFEMAGYAVLATLPQALILLSPLLFLGGFFHINRVGASWILAYMAVAGTAAVTAVLAGLSGLRWRIRTSVLSHTTVWNQVLVAPLEKFRVLPALEMTTKIYEWIAAEDDRATQLMVLFPSLFQFIVALALLMAFSPGIMPAVVMALLAIAAVQAAQTKARTTQVCSENELVAEILRPRNVVASDLPSLRSLGALKWALEKARGAARKELSAALRSENLRVQEDWLRLFAPAVIVITIGAASALGAMKGFSAGSVCVAVACSLWAASSVRKLVSAVVETRTAASIAGGAAAPIRRESVRPNRGQPMGPIARLSFEGVCFSYRGATEPTLQGLDFELDYGECLAIAGPSGSGKSTLVRLLTGLEHPTRGIVRANGIDLRLVNIADYRRRVGAVFQDQAVEMMTVRRLILGMAPISEDRAWEAARLAHISDAITALPMGMQTLLTRAAVPSAMVNQLLIARAVARAPELLVLDEALSNLEEPVQARLISDLRARGITLVICTHRPSSWVLADRVLRLEGGRIVE